MKKTKVTTLHSSHQNTWNKLIEYYNATDDAPQLYSAALLFHPQYRRHYFDRVWTINEQIAWKELLFSSVKEAWRTDYHGSINIEDEEDLLIGELGGKHKHTDSPDMLDKYLSRALLDIPVQTQTNDQFDTYINSPPVANINNIVHWWCAQPYEPLTQQAFDLISIPAMSADCEHLFSSAGDLLGDNRWRLHPETMERIELMRQWGKNDWIKLCGE